MSETIVRLPSPNFDKRDGGVRLQYIVLHYTDMETTEAALARMCDRESKVSAHYLVSEEGLIYQLVKEQDRAWHAGKSFWRGTTDLNSASIGIELSNPGHTYGYVPFPEEQITALKCLIKDIAGRNNMSAKTALLAHSDIAPDRKKDPGELFPWASLAADGLGLWPLSENEFSGPATLSGCRALLGQIGYDCGEAGQEEKTEFALIAFCRRYCPEYLGAPVSQETVKKLIAVAKAIATA